MKKLARALKGSHMPTPHTGSSCPVVTEPPVHPDMGAMGEQLVKFREDDFPSRKWGHLSDRQIPFYTHHYFLFIKTC